MYKLNFEGTIAADTVTGRGILVTSNEYLAWVAAGNKPLPADPIPNPAIAAINAQLSALDIKRIRPSVEGDAAYLAILNKQAVALRAERALLPATV